VPSFLGVYKSKKNQTAGKKVGSLGENSCVLRGIRVLNRGGRWGGAPKSGGCWVVQGNFKTQNPGRSKLFKWKFAERFFPNPFVLRGAMAL